VYGHGLTPLSISVDARDLRAALSTDAGLNVLVSLHIDGATHLTMARELQRHPIRGTVSHVDFQVVRRDEVVSAEVPIVLSGEAEAPPEGGAAPEGEAPSQEAQGGPAEAEG